ncbi:MAG: hypothetical protein ACI8X5_003281 [Planctomycetota bacterium]|jgi:hypothetical protein
MNHFLHTVYFWLRSDLEAARRSEFLVGLRKLADSTKVSSLRVGVPAGTLRDIVDNSWDFQIVAEFASRDAHDVYQSPEDPVHAAFIAGFSDCWARVQVYDSMLA